MNTNIPNCDLTRIISDGVKKAIADAIELELEAAKQKLADKIRASVGAIAATVTERLSYSMVGPELVIRLQIDQKPEIRIENQRPPRDRWLEQNDPLR